MSTRTSALEGMRTAIAELGSVVPFLTTSEAMELCALNLSWDTFLGYPEFILPRTVLNPHARRKAYVFDPRDVLALPFVLRQWKRAINEGNESTFIDDRCTYLRARDEQILRAVHFTEAA